MKKIATIGLALMMMASVCAMIVPTGAIAGDNIDTLATPPAGITPSALAWDNAGTMALMVGLDSNGDGMNAAIYYEENNTWLKLGAFPAMFTNYALTGVTWSDAFAGGISGWVAVGNARGPGLISAYYVISGETSMYELPVLGSAPVNVQLTDVASDEYGNVMAVGPTNIDATYFYNNQDGQWTIPMNMDDTGYFRGVDYDSNNHRYYMIGEDTTFGGSLIQYSDQIWDASAYPSNTWQYAANQFLGYFIDIHWNNDPELAPGGNFAVLYGSVNNYLYTIAPIELGVFVEESTDTPNIEYADMAWNEDTWDEATFIGQNGPLTEIYQYNMESDTTVLLYQSGALENAYCLDYKPAASPGWGMVLSSAGAVKIKITEFDITTTITANAVFPKMYWIGFNDTSGTSRLEQQVPLDSWYNFTVQANYSEGWTQCEIIVEAWYDWGATGDSSNMPSLTDGNRDLAFSMSYDAFTGTYGIIYPVGDLEVIVGAAVTETDTLNNPGSPTESHHVVEMPIYLGAQIRNATGNGFIAGGTYDSDKNVALNDAWSWDFEITVRDRVNTAGLANMSAEFGIDETVSISVSGNPAGNAPPGSGIQALSNPSIISYSANTDYWVNMSIPNLYENGIPTALDWINCDDVYAQNVGPNVTALNSDLFGALTAMPAAEDQDVCIWGAPGSPIGAPSNGTNATGPDVTNFNALAWGEDDFTQVNWGVDVQAATPEGVYWAVITFTIDS